MINRRSFVQNALIIPFAPAIVKIENIMKITAIEPLLWKIHLYKIHLKHPNKLYHFKGININSDEIQNFMKIYNDYKLVEKSLITIPNIYPKNYFYQFISSQ